ncbi:MinD/ParA family ATP-binding protein [Halostella salina]|uniref:MinD/ParA family ATP-binding protein n=1 Tax=Halostella salina TaxID=1547897 RepID=UPI000EF84902|nr:P-loop NTPase [Halostella salina]
MIAIAGGKGGCGKTTTTLGLARALADAGRRVLAVDVDLDMPNLHALAGVPAEPSLAAVGDESAASLAHPDPQTAGVRVLPAPSERPDDPAAAFAAVAANDQRVLLDCPAGAGPDAAAPLRAADATLLVSLPTSESLRDAAKTAAMARELGAPPAGAVVVQSEAVPDGVGELLGVDTTVAVPDGGAAPLRCSDTKAAFRRVAEAVGVGSETPLVN